MEAAREHPQAPRQREAWWPTLITKYGSETEMFRRVGIDRRVFDMALACVSEVRLETRGRPSPIKTIRERLLFLMIFMEKGVDTLDPLVFPPIKKKEYINHIAEVIAEKFGPVLVRSFVRFMDEEHPGAPNAALVVDCTVCQIRRPKQSFNEAKVYYSGKHCIYAMKKEVCVNIRSGTAAFVSAGFPGSKPDIEILKEDANEINALLGGKTILADLGYVGGERDVHGLVLCRRDNPQLRA